MGSCIARSLAGGMSAAGGRPNIIVCAYVDARTAGDYIAMGGIGGIRVIELGEGGLPAPASTGQP